MSHFFDDGIGAPPVDAMPGRSAPDYDALADLFLGDEPDAPALRLTEEHPTDDHTPPHADAPAAVSAMSAETAVEALVLGHLPVLAGAWAAQHARSLAEETGEPVALLRLSSDTATLQLLGVRAEPGLEFESFAEAARHARTLCRRWVLRVDATDELDLAGSDAVTSLSLLSGADDAAVVAAYRTLKGLDDVLPEDAPALAVRLMGASPADAETAAEKIHRVTRAFLDREIAFLPPTPQINAGSGTTLYRGGSDGDLAAALAIITAPADEPAADPGEHLAEPDAATDELPGDAADDHLAERIGLTVLPLVCPAAPAVAFGADDAGRLHLLGEGAGTAEELLVAEGWARTNAPVVLAAAGLAEDAEIVVRVLTDTPARDRGLLDSRFRVDLLREVRVGQDRAWCCVPLNTDD